MKRKYRPAEEKYKVTQLNERASLSLSISSLVIFRILGTITVLLILANAASLYFRFMLEHDHVFGFVPKFDLDGENNLPAYFSSFMLLIAAVLLGIIAVYHKRKHALHHLHWFILSVIFLFLSIDEAASLHELLTEPLRNALNLSGIFYFSWVVIGFFLLLILWLFYRKFFNNLPSKTRCQFKVSACIYIGGALGMELLGGYHFEIFGKDNLIFSILATFEEAFEMIGILLFIDALTKYIKENISSVIFSFESG